MVEYAQGNPRAQEENRGYGVGEGKQSGGGGGKAAARRI